MDTEKREMEERHEEPGRCANCGEILESGQIFCNDGCYSQYCEELSAARDRALDSELERKQLQNAGDALVDKAEQIVQNIRATRHSLEAILAMVRTSGGL